MSGAGILDFQELCSANVQLSCSGLSPLRNFSEGNVDRFTGQTSPSNWQIARDSILVTLFREK